MKKLGFRTKFGQEEMVGFGIIIIIVSIILVVFLWFFLSKPSSNSLESYEVESFLDSALQYTTTCGSAREVYFDIESLITECYNKRECSNGKNSCTELKDEFTRLSKESFKSGENRSVNGFEVKIGVVGDNFLDYKEGNLTGNSKGAQIDLSRGREVSMVVYFKP